jgi:hypothetical protein
MSEMNASPTNSGVSVDHVEGEDHLLETLRAMWLPHQRRDLEIRYKMGLELNLKLDRPTKRQSYGLGTIDRVSRELGIDKSDISRMRRFAAMYDSFEDFLAQEPEATSWTKVRELVVGQKNPGRSPDSRALWGALRSAESLIEAFSREQSFAGPKADELRLALGKLYRLAHARLGFEVGNLVDEELQTDSQS